jgi:signal transduction histidine kinase
LKCCVKLLFCGNPVSVKTSVKTLTLLTLLWLFYIPVFSQDVAIQAFKQALPSITDSPRYVDVLNRISILSYEQNTDSTLFYANKAREIARRIDYAQGIADATDNLAVYFDINGTSELALRYYSDAYNRYTGLGDSSNMAQTLMNIAMVYNTDGNNDKAVINYKAALSLGQKLTRDSILSLVIYNFLLQYPRQFATDSTDFYINKAVQIAERYHDTRLLLAIEQLKANRYIQQDQRATGIRLLENALAGGLREKLFYMSIDIIVELGDLYSTTDSAKAVAYYQQALDITQAKKYSSYERDMNNKLYDFYAARKDKERAYEYSAALIRLYRKKQETDNQSGIDYITYALKDQELETIREKTVYANRLLWLEGIACLLAAVIISMFWRNARQNRRIHATLEHQYKRLTTTTTALENGNKNYARLIRVVAHDLRNPIGAINSITSMKMGRTSQSKDEEWMQLVEKASQRCLQLITELLETDFEIREETLQKEKVDVTALVQQAAQLLNYRATEKHQQLIIRESTVAPILADREKLTRVLDNLVVNAIKFSPNGAAITITTAETPTDVIISVHDTGMGIPPEIADKLFEPFESTVKRKGTAGEQSFGLGLYICRQIIQAHGGRIWFESQPGQGSDFFISLRK